MLKHLLSLTLLSVVALSAAQKDTGAIRMVFNDTDVSTVLRAIGARTGANIVYSNKQKTPVTLNITANNVEQAVKIVAATAGLAYRKAGQTLVVAPQEAMRGALEPFSYTVTFTLEPGSAEKLVAPINTAFPHATARAVGDKIVFTGLLEDVREVKTFIETMRAREERTKATTEVMSLSVASPTAISKLVSSMYPSLKISTTGDENTVGGVIGLAGPIADVESAKRLIQSMDFQSSLDDPNSIVYRVYELRYTDGLQAEEFIKKSMPGVEIFVSPASYTPSRARFNPMAAALSAAGGGAGGGGGFGGGAAAGSGSGGSQTQAGQGQEVDNLRSKSVVLKGRRSVVENAITLLQSVDTKPKQVVVEVNVAEINQTQNDERGINWNWSPFDFHELAPGTQVEQNPEGNAWDTYPTRPAGLGMISKAPLNFRAILNALVSNGNAKILARPSVTVIDNDQATVFIGNTIRVRTTSAGALGAQNIEVEEFPVGIILLISPRVNADGNITLKVNPVISSVVEFDRDGIPQTRAREAETSVIVKNGETFVIGGLISEEEQKAVSAIPILSKLPIVGELFKNTRKQKGKTEIVVSLTPRLIDEEGQLEDR